jgi:hypothetical protein
MALPLLPAAWGRFQFSEWLKAALQALAFSLQKLRAHRHAAQ